MRCSAGALHLGLKKTMTNRNILILGTGALATLFAARFSKTGADVTMLGTWQAALDALNRDGAHLIDANGHEIAYPVRAVAECQKAELALVLVKSWQTERAAHQLSGCLSSDGLAITLQNGLGNGEMLASALGAERVVQGVTMTGAALIAPGVVRAGGEGLVSLEAHPGLGAFSALLAKAGFQSEVVSSAASLLWSKLVINAAINPLTALLNIPNGELLKRPSARKLMGALALETAAVAAAQKIQLVFDDPVAAVEAVAQRTANNFSSMLQDLRRGAPTEIESICGAVVRLGVVHQVETAVNKTIRELVLAHVERG